MTAKIKWAAAVTSSLLKERFIKESTQPQDVLGIIDAILFSPGKLNQLVNSTSLSPANVTAVLHQFYDCIQNKTTANRTAEVWNCFVQQQEASPTPPPCYEMAISSFNTFFFFTIGTIVLLGLSFTRVRKACALRCCFGRPGCVIPLNMLDSYENRFGNALAFGATTTRCCLILLGDNQSLLGSSVAAYLADPNTPKFMGVLAKIFVTVVVATAYYPLFAFMNWDNKILGSLLGAIYTIMWMIAIFVRLVLAGVCVQGSKKYIAFILAYEAPGVLCLLLLLVKFIYVLQGAIRQWLSLRRKGADISQMTYEQMFWNWKELYMYKHVSNLLKGSKAFGIEEPDDDDDIKWKDKLKKKVYKFKPDFKYSTRVICAISVATYAAYVVVVSLAYGWYILVTQLLRLLVYSEDFVNFFKGNTDIVKMLRDLFDVLHVSFYVGAVFAGVVMVVVVMNMLSWYRGHIMRLRKGDRSWMPSAVVKKTASPASLTAASMKFAGYQVGYCVWGIVMLTIVFWVILSIFGTQIALPIRNRTWSPLLRFLYRLWPALLLTLVINFLQVLSAKFIFLHDRGASFSINNRNAFHVLSFYLFFFNIALGIVSCLLRILYSVILGVLFLARLQKSLLPRSFEKRDPGYMSYVGYLLVEHSHANPVLCVFTMLLCEHCHALQNVRTIDNSSESGEYFKLRKVSCEEEGAAYKARKRRLVARNRWQVAMTLSRNPSLAKYRSPTPKMKSINRLVKGLCGVDNSVHV